MIFLAYGEEEYLINKFINHEIERKKIEIINRYDYPKDSLSSIIEDASYDDLFSSKKAIIVENATFLVKEDKDEEELINYLNDPNPNNYVFFIMHVSKIDERKKLIRLLQEKHNVRLFSKGKETDALKFIKTYLNDLGVSITPELCKIIFDRVINDYSIISNELDKLVLYLKDKKEVTNYDIENVISKYAVTDVFKLTNILSSRNLKKIMSYYNDLVLMGNHPSVILTLVSNQIRLIYQVKILLREMYSETEIASMLKVHPYQVKLASGNASIFSEEELLKYLYKLALIDEDIKLGTIPIESSLEGFFIEFCK